jgi:hypothetical protein
LREGRAGVHADDDTEEGDLTLAFKAWTWFASIVIGDEW